MKEKGALHITQGAIIAALYVVLTFFCNMLGISNGVIQVRFSEALTILAIFTPAAIPGLSVGCFIANLVTGCAIFDVLFGTLATFLGAVGTYMLRKHRFLAWIPPVLFNTIIIPAVLLFVYEFKDAYWFMLLTVFAGEVISCGILGELLQVTLYRKRNILFPKM